ncbi:MAG TPA: GTP 3',8-cyclase MoaA [Planctomycetota bacterium]|nr:GTP 3',8-cyclase MoaA [Planctomycetota bacterium]
MRPSHEGLHDLPADRPLTELLRRGTQPRIIDQYGRTFTYLRVSVTDLCNLRCVYCMPEEGMQWLPRDQILSFEEIATVVEAAAACGVYKVRLTGGEPLVRKEIQKLAAIVAKIPGITDLALTTNGTRLGDLAGELAAAGLKRINISLDTLKPERFKAIARRHELGEVLHGIAAARRAGLKPIKINMVVLGGLNDDEVADFAAMTLEQDLEVRFIEYMPLEEAKGCAMGSGNFGFIPNDVTKRRISERFGALEPLETGHGMKGPAEVFRLNGALGRLGFISAMSAPFCRLCDRLRLTATGEIRSCLLDGGGIEIKSILRSGGTREQIIEAFKRAAQMKPEVHKDWAQIPPASMSRIGG